MWYWAQNRDAKGLPHHTHSFVFPKERTELQIDWAVTACLYIALRKRKMDEQLGMRQGILAPFSSAASGALDAAAIAGAGAASGGGTLRATYCMRIFATPIEPNISTARGSEQNRRRSPPPPPRHKNFV